MTDTTSQSTFIQSLFRIDPTQGFVEYVQATKPYHTKILDVIVEYVYADDVNVTFTEDLTWEITIVSPDQSIVYTCGYGIVWDPVLTASTPDAPLDPVLILEATEAIESPSAGFENSNSFLIQRLTSYASFVSAVASTTSNQLVLSKNYDMDSVNVATKTWYAVDGSNTLPSELSAGDVFYVSTDSGALGNGRYTVQTVTPNTPGVGYTAVTTVESIPVQAMGDGLLHRVFTIDEVPSWPTGQAVTLTTSTGTLPSPVASGTRYFFQPHAEVGYFNLSYNRYPTKYTDFVDLTDIGSGEFTILRDESFVPGATVNVKDTHYHSNDGSYTVKEVVAEGSDERVFVYQKVDSTTPASFLNNDGYMTLSDTGYDEPAYCPPAFVPDLYAAAFIDESLQFDFAISFTDSVGTTVKENAPIGYGEIFGGASLGVYGTYADNVYSRTAVTSGSGADSAHTVLPTGIDTQLFDIGGLEETVQTVKQFYGRDLP